MFTEIRKLILGEKDEPDVGEKELRDRDHEKLKGYFFMYLFLSIWKEIYRLHWDRREIG